MIGRIEATLKARGVAGNTYIVFSSDNGYHMGDHRLLPGKMTAFDTDINVPLIVAGPGVARGRTLHAIAENIDLRPTFSKLAGARGAEQAWTATPSCPCSAARSRPTGAARALVEHHGPDFQKGDPDLPLPGSGNPQSYEALRTGDAVYVEYANGQREYYNVDHDPFELRNTYSKLDAAKRRAAALGARGRGALPQRQSLLGGAAPLSVSGRPAD